MLAYLKPSKEMLLDAINFENNLQDKPLTYDQIALGLAQSITTLGPKNTRLLVYGLKGQGYRGTVTLQYNRFSLEAMFRNTTVMLIGGSGPKLSNLLPLFNRQFGLALEADDIIDVDLSGLGEEYTVDMVARDSSVGWIGSIKIHRVPSAPKLVEVITDQSLSAILSPVMPSDKPRVEYLTYGYDYSDLADVLDKTNTPSSITELLCQQLNEIVPCKFTTLDLATAPEGSISLKDAMVTKNVAVTPGSIYNQDFVRAVEIELAATSNYAGKLIIHYRLKE